MNEKPAVNYCSFFFTLIYATSSICDLLVNDFSSRKTFQKCVWYDDNVVTRR